MLTAISPAIFLFATRFGKVETFADRQKLTNGTDTTELLNFVNSKILNSIDLEDEDAIPCRSTEL